MKVHSLIMMMVLAVTMVTGMTLTREKRQNYDALLQNKAFVVSQINCVLRRGQCDRIGNRIRILVPEVVKSKVCLSCTEDEKVNVQKVTDHVEQNYPKEWNEIREQYTEKEESQVEDGEEQLEEEEEVPENNEEETLSSSSSSSSSEKEKSGKSVVVSAQIETESETETGSGKTDLIDVVGVEEEEEVKEEEEEEETVISKKETAVTKKHIEDEKLAIKTEATSTKAITAD